MAGFAYPTAPAPVPRVRMRATVWIGLVLFFVGMVGSAAVSFTGDVGDTIVLAVLAVVGIVLVTSGGRKMQADRLMAAQSAALPQQQIPWNPPGGPYPYPPGAGDAAQPTVATSVVPAPPPPPPVAQVVASVAPFCTRCGTPTTFIAQYGRFYCYPCARYA